MTLLSGIGLSEQHFSKRPCESLRGHLLWRAISIQRMTNFSALSAGLMRTMSGAKLYDVHVPHARISVTSANISWN
jgi:hypothetical protein